MKIAFVVLIGFLLAELNAVHANDITVISLGRADQAALTKTYYRPFREAPGSEVKSFSYEGQTTELEKMAKKGKNRLGRDPGGGQVTVGRHYSRGTSCDPRSARRGWRAEAPFPSRENENAPGIVDQQGLDGLVVGALRAEARDHVDEEMVVAEAAPLREAVFVGDVVG